MASVRVPELRFEPRSSVSQARTLSCHGCCLWSWGLQGCPVPPPPACAAAAACRGASLLLPRVLEPPPGN